MDKYYVVKKGNKPGIYTSWLECKQSINHYKGSVYKKFNSLTDATAYFNNNNITNINMSETCQSPSIKKNNNTMSEIVKISDDDMNKIIAMSNTINSAEYSQNINYNVNCWTCIENDIYIFTDGSSRKMNKSNNLNTENCNSGMGIYLGNQCINIKEQYYNKTNNHCELLAIEYAFNLIIRYYKELSVLGKTINIISDSEYAIKSCTIWLSQWKTNNWKTSSGEDVKNKLLIENIDTNITRIKLINSNLDVTHKIKVKITHIHSHQHPNIQDKFKFTMWYGNYIADLLATNKI